MSVVEEIAIDPISIIRERPIGSRVGKAAQRACKVHEGAAYKRVEARRVFAKAIVAKNFLRAEQKLYIFMTRSNSQITCIVAKRFLQMR